MQIDDILLRTSIFRLVFFIALAGLSIILGMNVKKQGELYKKFNKEYKLTYIKALLQNFESNIDYFPEQGISSEEYKQIGYEKYDNFKSDDYMKGVLKNGCKIELADVLTHKVSQDSSSKSMLLFTGIFSVIESPKEFNEILYIVQDSVAINQNNIKVEKIDLDSQEFEKNFNVYGTNKIVAMQLLTADIMQMLTEFKLQNGLRYEIAIKNSKIYMRFFSGPMFEAVKTGSEQQFKEELYRTYEILKFICEISYKMIDLIKSVEY